MTAVVSGKWPVVVVLAVGVVAVALILWASRPVTHERSIRRYDGRHIKREQDV